MAIGAITMILANVGLQIYNNWCGSRQNAALQQKREEFERAAKERNTEHMWRLLREGQEIALQLENEKHADRLKELKDEVDHLLEKLTYETTISNWPLKVLPIVMKNQAFGNLLANQEENVAMHVIFTRSNYDKFNKLVFPIVEKQLEQYCDKHWSTMTDHSILFYSGAWKPVVNPTDVQVTAMREELKNLPTLLITPFFRPNDGKLVFQLHMWGVGTNSTDKFDVPEIEPTEFQRSFNNQDDYDNEEGLLYEIVEDLVPYLECMIGYMADTYFWSSAGLAPHLPLLFADGTICTDGMKYLINDSRKYYDWLLAESVENAKENPFMQEKLYNLIDGSASLWSDNDNLKKREKCLLMTISAYCAGIKYNSIEDLVISENIKELDIEVIENIIKSLQLFGFIKESKIVEQIKKDINDSPISTNGYSSRREDIDEEDILTSLDYDLLLNYANNNNGYALFRLGEFYEYSIIGELDLEKSKQFYNEAAQNNCCLAIIKKEIEKFKNNGQCDKTKINNQIETLKQLLEKNICQAILFTVEMSYLGIVNLLETDELLTTLDLVESSNHPYAYYLGAIIILKIYGNKYSSKIVELLKKSASLGYVESQLLLANIYKEGKLVSTSTKECIKYYKLAASQGSGEALTSLGICFIEGFGVWKSKEEALKMFRLAAELGDKDALSILNR